MLQLAAAGPAWQFTHPLTFATSRAFVLATKHQDGACAAHHLPQVLCFLLVNDKVPSTLLLLAAARAWNTCAPSFCETAFEILVRPPNKQLQTIALQLRWLQVGGQIQKVQGDVLAQLHDDPPAVRIICDLQTERMVRRYVPLEHLLCFWRQRSFTRVGRCLLRLTSQQY